jgi:L-alanine-DL-glutamate epimerase-like enolase superfamily enzyme
LGIGLAASLHWAAVLSGEGTGGEPVWIEVDTLENPVRDALLDPSAWFGSRGAAITLPDLPGLGVDPERIVQYRVA